MKTTLSVVESWCRNYGPVFRVKFGPKSIIFLNSPEYVQKLLGSTDMNHHAKGFIYEPLKPVWNDGLIISTGEKWKFRRRLLDRHIFSYKTLFSYMKIFNEEADSFVLKLRETDSRKGVAIDNLLKEATLNSILQAAIGVKIPDIALVDKDDICLTAIVDRMKELATKRIVNPWLLFKPLWRLHPLSKTEDFLSQMAWKQARKVIDQNAALNARNNESLGEDLLAAGVSVEGILEEVSTLISAGYETTESALQFLFFFLALHPHHQEKCRQEVDSLFGDNEANLEYRDLNKLKHLEMCIHETLRLFPTVFLIMRKLNAPLRLENDLELAVGSEVAIFMPGIHKDPNLYPNPNDFIPERFSPEESQHRHKYSYVPFSNGPRKCIGFKFAIMEMMCLTAKLLRHFVISTADKYEDIVVLPYITLTLEKPINFIFKRRHPTSPN
ncbi:Cytochrome P450 4V2 [Orchesella cincta]|uniref:Cytochrome P450 4V2 n=1 Tax=Orchesella cincta TaxID=48709 RepID=A0A1D2MNE6_ORCCI|nr:Cytochrome P450 4V2 [Orchesella cincta]